MSLFDDIIKAIEEEIEKCNYYTGMISSLPTKVKGTMNKFNQDTRGLEHEKGIVITDKGETVMERDDGNEFSVNVPWSGIPYEILKAHIGLNVDHNHPLQQGFEGFATCLSEADIYHLAQLRPKNLDSNLKPLKDENGHYEYEFAYKSVSAEGGNGSRMTLSIVDEDRFRAFAYENGDINPKFRRGIKHFCGENGTYSRFLRGSRQETTEHMKEWGTDYLKQARKKDKENLSLTSFLKGVHDERMNYQKEYCQDYMEYALSGDVRFFNSIGLELSFGWVK